MTQPSVVRSAAARAGPRPRRMAIRIVRKFEGPGITDVPSASRNKAPSERMCSVMVPSGRAGEGHDPVGLPGLAVVVGEGLAPTGGARGDLLPAIDHLHRPVAVHILAIEQSNAILEAAEHRVLQRARLAVHPVDGPEAALDVEGPEREALEAALGEVVLVDVAEAAHQALAEGRAVEHVPILRADPARLEAPVLDGPAAVEEVEVAPSVVVGVVSHVMSLALGDRHSWRLLPPACQRPPACGASVDDRGVDDVLELAAEVEGAGRHELGHEHDAEIFLRVDPEDRRGRAAPVVVAAAEPARLHLAQGGGKAQAEPDTV